jgi:hypothetical protein
VVGGYLCYLHAGHEVNLALNLHGVQGGKDLADVRARGHQDLGSV